MSTYTENSSSISIMEIVWQSISLLFSCITYNNELNISEDVFKWEFLQMYSISHIYSRQNMKYV